MHGKIEYSTTQDNLDAGLPKSWTGRGTTDFYYPILLAASVPSISSVKLPY